MALLETTIYVGLGLIGALAIGIPVWKTRSKDDEKQLTSILATVSSALFLGIRFGEMNGMFEVILIGLFAIVFGGLLGALIVTFLKTTGFKSKRRKRRR